MSTGGVQQQLRLAPAPDSAGTARRLVADVLSAARAEPFTDSATLLTSELVTNGIVHANTELHVVVEATATWVRVEVADGNPHLPSRRDYDDEAMTGRGLEMVELLADDFGVEPLEGDGKRVWFRLGAVPGTPPGEPVAAEPERKKLALALRNLPVALYCAWQPHADALLREAVLAAYDEDAEDLGGEHPLAAQALGALAEAAGDIFTLHDEHDVAIMDATVLIDQDSVPWFPILREVLNRAAALSRAGKLLVPPSLPEIVALRNWICDEVARQSAGLPPTPWAGIDGHEAAPPQVAPELLARVRQSTDAVIAADVSNRIVAVSEPVAELLGWDRDDLEGRRLVSIVPPRMRDRHIAGFTRHLVTGSATILGRQVAVPALRRDGTEIEVNLLIERWSNPPYHWVFVATVTV